MPTTITLGSWIQEMGRVFLLGVILYISPTRFITLGAGWFPELEGKDDILDRARFIRRNFWKKVRDIIAITAMLLTVMYLADRKPPDDTMFHSWWFTGIAIFGLLVIMQFPPRGSRPPAGDSIIDRIDQGQQTFARLSPIFFFLVLVALF